MGLIQLLKNVIGFAYSTETQGFIIFYIEKIYNTIYDSKPNISKA